MLRVSLNFICFGLAGAILSVVGGCANLNPAQEAGLVTAFGAQAPTNEVQQIYYLGVFDPREQVPPTIYRVRVSGQASLISGVKFASGWVPAAIADSLGSRLSFNENGDIALSGSEELQQTLLEGRTMMAFGPEGYRKAPKDHRLVIVMGSSPEDYFSAVDRTLGRVAEVRESNRNQSLSQKLLKTLADLDSEQRQLNALKVTKTGAVQ